MKPPWLRFRLGYVLILAAVLLFSIKFTSRAWQAHELGVQVAAVSTQLSQEAADNNRLAREIRRYKTIKFVYQEARSLGYVHPGDRPVVISYRPEGASPRHSTTHLLKMSPPPTWQQWWDAFFGGN